jgi:formylglycine-generating enzyme required for sulfatase activity
MNHPVTPALGLAVLAGFSLVSPAFAVVSMEYVRIGNVGNAADSPTGYGSVAHVYNIGKYEVTYAQYVDFLNAKGASNSAGIFNATMGSYGLTKSGSSGHYSYSVLSSYANKPVIGVSWFDAARFCNWLGNGQGDGDMETGAYTLNGATSGVVTVNAGAAVYIPGENEWYKAAYYNGATASYSLYPNGKDTISTVDANYAGVIIKTVGYGAPSSNGTYGQGGNAWEWNDAVTAGRGLRGGSWNSNHGGGVGSYVFDLASTGRGGEDPSSESIYIGFRVASVPIAVWLASKGFSPNTSPLTPVAKLGGANLLMAYALNLDPNQSYSSDPLPKAVMAGNQMSYTFYAGNTDVGYRVETSTDLASWSTSGVTVSAPDANGNSTASVPSAGGTRFIRLVVSH